MTTDPTSPSTPANRATPLPDDLDDRPLMPEHDLRWFAAVFEMRGKVRKLQPESRKNPLFSMVLETGRINVIRRMAAMTGSVPRITEPTAFSASLRKGCAEHCPTPHKHITHNLPLIGRWHISGAGAIVVATAIVPYMLEDTTELEVFAEDAMRYVPRVGVGRGRHAVNQTILRLAGLGWSIPPALHRAGDDD